MVTEGIEPSTVALLAQRSNQLSYATYLIFNDILQISKVRNHYIYNHITSRKSILLFIFTFLFIQFVCIIYNTTFREAFFPRYKVDETIIFNNRYFNTLPFIHRMVYRNNNILVHQDHFTIIIQKVYLYVFLFFLYLKFLIWRTFNHVYVTIYQVFKLVNE